MRFEYAPGATPIDPDEAKGLIPAHLTLQRELNEYEESNILEATAWLFARRRGDPLDERLIHVVHSRMFNQTWKWAGKSRRTDMNIGVSWFEIPVRLRQMLGDVRAQIEHQAYSPAEIAARYHHRLVAIHVVPNGNGRHAAPMCRPPQCCGVGCRMECAGADRADLDPFQWAKGPGKGCLHVVRDVLTAEQQHAVFFHGGASRSIHTIAASHVDQADAPHFDAEIGVECTQFQDNSSDPGVFAWNLELTQN